MRAGVVEAGVTKKMNRCPEAAQPAPIGGAASLERGTLRRTPRSLSPKVDHLARDARSVTRGKQLEEDLVAPGLEDGDRDVCAALVRRARRRLERSSRQTAEVRDGRKDPIRIDSEERPADAEALDLSSRTVRGRGCPERERTEDRDGRRADAEDHAAEALSTIRPPPPSSSED